MLVVSDPGCGPMQALSAREILERTMAARVPNVVGTGEADIRAFLAMVKRDVRICLQAQAELRGVPIRMQEMGDLSDAVDVAVDQDPGILRVTVPDGWLESVDQILSNRWCAMCGSLVAAGEHRVECGSALAESVMVT